MKSLVKRFLAMTLVCMITLTMFPTGVFAAVAELGSENLGQIQEPVLSNSEGGVEDNKTPTVDNGNAALPGIGEENLNDLPAPTENESLSPDGSSVPNTGDNSMIIDESLAPTANDVLAPNEILTQEEKPAQSAVSTIKSVEINGQPTVYGKTLTTNIVYDTAVLPGNTAATYQWFSVELKDGNAEIETKIEGATGATLTLDKAELVGKSIRVKVSAVGTGAEIFTATTTGIVAKAEGLEAPRVVTTASENPNSEILLTHSANNLAVLIGSEVEGGKTAYEYSLDGGATWIDLLDGNILLKPEANAISVRAKETATNAAGKIIETSLKISGWVTIAGDTYYFLDDNTKAIGLQTLVGKNGLTHQYMFDTEGRLLKGWYDTTGNRDFVYADLTD
ncbi:MAG: hypothetical protein RR635_10750, partial [Oscillospiraceae bacterium]